jgi:hypothetical protein
VHGVEQAIGAVWVNWDFCGHSISHCMVLAGGYFSFSPKKLFSSAFYVPVFPTIEKNVEFSRITHK